MEDKLCEVKHKRLDEKIDVHEKRINNHSERLDRIELSTGRLEERPDLFNLREEVQKALDSLAE